MSWFSNIFSGGSSKKSAVVAKERLQVILTASRRDPDYLPKLQKEIMAVIAKYVSVQEDQVLVEFAQKGERQILELNVTLPEGK